MVINMKDIIVIVGPTGVGKTKLSIELAKKIDAEIINGDSVAIYKDLNIGSAKATKEEQREAIHHLIDVCDVEEQYSVYSYQKEVRKLIKDISDRGKRIIIVGGTGLYIKAALYDYSFNEEPCSSDFSSLSSEELIVKLKEYGVEDFPHINNRRRLERLLNKCINGGDLKKNKDTLLYPIKVIGLTTDRNVLYERINKRVDLMIKSGLLNEVNGLKEKYLKSRILNTAIGYKEFYDYLYNGKDLEEVIFLIKQNSRRYAKRQYTFFKHQFDIKWFDVDFDNFNVTVAEVYNYVNQK